MPARRDIKSICVLGSGPVIIGQAAEFDYSGTQAIKALKEDGYRIILINSNPATIMTDPDLADATYIEPLCVAMVAEILKKERPDALLPTVGWQTALNLAVALFKKGILHELGIELIGADVDVIERAENRQLFKETVASIGLNSLRSITCHTLYEAKIALEDLGLPSVIRPSYTLGGTGGGIAYSDEEFDRIVAHGLAMSPSHEVLIEESALGWKEFEFEVMRDGNDNSVIICSIENLDPMGVHTGDSITVAPAQTLTDKEYQILRNASLAIMRAVGVKTGGSNVQFAVKKDEIYVIEVNPRASRTVPFVSKAIGVSLPKLAALIMSGKRMADLNLKPWPILRSEFSFFSVKEAVMPFLKFPDVDALLGPEVHSTGEVMGIASRFEEAFAKSQMGAGMTLPTSGTIFVSIADPDKSHMLEALRRMHHMGFHILATSGTHGFLQQHDIPSECVKKVREGTPHVLDRISNGDVSLMFNTTLGAKSVHDSYLFRRKAIEQQIPYYTTVEAALAASLSIEHLQSNPVFSVSSLQKHLNYQG